MQTKTLIQSSANILRITDLQKGNTVKVIKKDYSDNKIFFGVVTDLLNSGESTFIELLLFEKSYNDLKGKVVVYIRVNTTYLDGKDDIALFPATVEEVETDLSDALKLLARDIEKSEDELLKKKNAYEKASEFVSGEMQKKLQSTSFKEITTQQYLDEEKQKKILAISDK